MEQDVAVAFPTTDRVRLYDRMASGYERRHARWLRHAGGEPQAALEGAVRALVAPGTRLLDVGCGTGGFARRLVRSGFAQSNLTLLDPSNAMLERCSDIRANTIKGQLEALPFADQHFDLVTCAWALETATDLDLALSELCRVVRKGGTLCLVFCADRAAGSVLGWMLRRAVSWNGAGEFLDPAQVVARIRASGRFHVQEVPARGPAAALIAQRF